MLVKSLRKLASISPKMYQIKNEIWGIVNLFFTVLKKHMKMEVTSMNLYIIYVIYLLLRFYRLSVPVTSCILQKSSFSFKMFDQRFLSQLIQNIIVLLHCKNLKVTVFFPIFEFIKKKSSKFFSDKLLCQVYLFF